MAQVNEINAAFYAMRLLSHHLDFSQIEVTYGEEYPATEFTAEEQAHALKILRELDIAASQQNTEATLVSLADRIEELCDKELAEAGYAIGRQENVFNRSDKASSVARSAGPIRRKRFDSRESEMLKLFVEGRSTEDIAKVLHISLPRVRAARLRLKMKMNKLIETRQIGLD